MLLFFGKFLKKIKQPLVLVLVGLLMAGCSELQLGSELTKQGRRTAAGGVYKVGNPYQIAGDWYYPRENTSYNNVGTASWYGSKFQGRRTANGEIFDMNLLTAAHPTLPLPVIAQVTNLGNGRSIKVRINDRGPFKKNREIDLSQRGAELLGFRKNGTAKVRVRYIQDAPLYDQRGNLISGSEPESYVLEKPKTSARDQYVGAAPKGSVKALALEGSQGFERPQVFSGSAYYVQLGVFTNRQNAKKLIEKLSPQSGSNSGIDIEPVYSGGRSLYRVRLGPLSSWQQANKKIDYLLDLGHQDALIIEGNPDY